MALSGSGSAYYRSNATIPSSEGLHAADSIHCWVMSSIAPSTANFRGICGFVGGGGSGAQRPQEYMNWNQTGVAYYKARQHRTSGGSYVSAQIASTPATNTWEPWTSTFDGANVRIYRNGVLEGTSAATTAGAAQQVFVDVLAIMTYAGALDSSSQFVEGAIAEVALWNAALDVAEVNSLAKRFRPSLIRPAALRFYSPLIRELVDLRGGRTLVKQAGTDVQIDHPPIIG